MILVWMIGILLAGGVAAWAAARRSADLCRRVALAAVGAELILALGLWASPPVATNYPGRWVAAVDWPWIDSLGIRFCLMADGIGVLMLLLVGVVGLLAVAASWRDVTHRVGFFHFALLWALAALCGAFVAMDLLLFFFFFEMMLVPLFLMILLWGREHRRRAAIKFFLFTQLGGLFLLVGVLGLYFLHYARTGTPTFRFFDLVHEPMSRAAAWWIMLGFFAAFAVKLPVVPVHGWLPDAHAEAPVGGSVVLAGLVLKVGAYGLLRFLLPLFPLAVVELAPAAMILAVVGILYGAVQSYGQSDLKRLVAYSSISHMGIVLLGVFSRNELALQGAMVTILAHGVSTGALFALAGMVHRCTGTYDMGRMGGLWKKYPWLGGAAMVLAMASVGLPGLANFIGEFLVLLGAWKASPVLTILAAGALIVSVPYSLKIIQQVFHGRGATASDLPAGAGADLRERAMLAGCIAILVWLGLAPQAVLRTSAAAMQAVSAAAATAPAPNAVLPNEPGANQ